MKQNILEAIEVSERHDPQQNTDIAIGNSWLFKKTNIISLSLSLSFIYQNMTSLYNAFFFLSRRHSKYVRITLMEMNTKRMNSTLYLA